MRKPRAQVVVQFMHDGEWINAQPLPDRLPSPVRPVRQADTAGDEQAYGGRVARRRTALLSHLGVTVRWHRT